MTASTLYPSDTSFVKQNDVEAHVLEGNPHVRIMYKHGLLKKNEAFTI